MMKKRAALLFAMLALLAGSLASAQSTMLRVPIDATRSRDDAFAKADAAVRTAAWNFDQLTTQSRALKARYNPKLQGVPFFMPVTVRFTQNGKDLTPAAQPVLSPATNAITLVFDTTGPGVFPSAYQSLLQNVFAAAQPTMNLVFGPPSSNGPVHVVNFDASIGDRQAVAGGYFVPGTGSTQPEIRFPVYSSPEATAVNFVHTLLLAYLGNDSYSFDAFQEGLVRAATMRIMRTPGVLAAGLDPSQVETVLTNSYDVGGFYDWYNQPGLEGPNFIAPNLLTTPLPSGGSVGGPYLLRYRMGGSAWLKVLVQYPTFIAQLNQRLYATPSLGSNPTALIAAGQSVLNQVAGVPAATVEGFSLSNWVLRQYILHVNTVRGQRLLVEPTPITSGLSGTDFGVFLIEAHYFQTSGADNETLLSATSFPIFWEGDISPVRIFPSAQEDRMDIAGAYGAVAPNLPDLNAGAPYRVAAEIPVGDQLERVYLPAGGIATTTNPTPNTFFGTVIGATGTLHVMATIGANTIATVPVVNGAFGFNVTDASFLNNASVMIQVIQTSGGIDSTIASRIVNKGPGPLAVDLRVGGEATFNPFGGTFPAGLSAVGMPLQPYMDYEPNVLQTSTPSTLVARYNPNRGAYDLFPEIESFHIGHGYFVNEPVATIAHLLGRTHPGMAMSVALKPGWNMVTIPKMVAMTTTNIQVVHAADFPNFWINALGTDIGTDYFKFMPGPNDAGSGVPETGSFAAVTDNTFQPGVPYYVRVLDPEGVTLNFEPASASSPNIVALPAATTPGWKMNVQAISSTRSSLAIIGESPTATVGFDPKEDSGLPPTMGGLQVVLQGTQPLYRDMRPLGMAWQTYKVHVEGLTAGLAYTLKLTMTQGKIPYCTLYDAGINYTRPAWPSSAPVSYVFTAKADTRDFSITTPGVTQ